MKKIRKYSKWFVCIVVVFFAVTGGLVVYDWPGALKYFWWDSLLEKWLGPTAAVVKEGDVAPDFTAKDLEGKEISLSSFRGKPVLLVFWSRH